ncbi:hypothetical protein [Streptomyces sp. SID3343]|uniref:hypothetical protein n=1 Tax=Streptomyces sp. SID3343 TaxID=2690260 RepID=UPI001370A53B|nr:hypothetical protein [Streptomyces sp. SID3343]MYV98760.1 hypothetical protein [Streptomyces sp. SID3343]
MSDPRRVTFASPEEEAAAQDTALANRFRAIGSTAADRLPMPFHIGGYNMDRDSMTELGEDLWGADEMREALTTTPGQKLNLCLRRDGDVLLIRHPTDPDTVLAACLAPTHVNLDHDWTHDPHAPAVLHVPADPHRAVEAIAATLLPQQKAAVTTLRQAAVADGTEVVVGVGRTWRHAGQLTAQVTDTADWHTIHDLEYHGLTRTGHCVYTRYDWDRQQADHLVEHLQHVGIRVRKGPDFPEPADAARRSGATSTTTVTTAPGPTSSPPRPPVPPVRPGRPPRP